uniref:Uncharacterized protein n=1 Tax=Brugia timori TaxID=42155 RepID=A0A0R3RCG0_9BILA
MRIAIPYPKYIKIASIAPSISIHQILLFPILFDLRSVCLIIF